MNINSFKIKNVLSQYSNIEEIKTKNIIQPIIQFRTNDIFHIKLNLLSKNFVNFEDIFFKAKIKKCDFSIKTTLSEIPKINTKNKIDYSELNFLEGRLHEFEYIKTKWQKISNMDNWELFEKKIKNLFSPFFLLEKIEFDYVGFYIFKIELRAIKKGDFYKEEIGINFRIKDEYDYLVNGIKRNYLLFEKMDIIQKIGIRKNDLIILYLKKDGNEEFFMK